jgi:hypothetical protein
MNNNIIKIFGITFGKRCYWTHHILSLKNLISPRLNIIEMLAHTSWGSKTYVLLTIYKSLIISKLNYGSFIWQTVQLLLNFHSRVICHIKIARDNNWSSPIIFTDSLSAINNIKNTYNPSDICLHIQNKIYTLQYHNNFKIKLFWIPGHFNIKEDEL